MSDFEINENGEVRYISKTEKKKIKKLYILALVLIVLAIINIAEILNSVKITLEQAEKINSLENTVEQQYYVIDALEQEEN